MFSCDFTLFTVAQFVCLWVNNIEVYYQCFKKFIIVSFEGRLLPIWQNIVIVVLVGIKGKRDVAV